MRAVIPSKMKFRSARVGSLLLAALVVGLSMVKLMLDGNALLRSLKSMRYEENQRLVSQRKKVKGSSTRRHVLIGNPVEKNRFRLLLDLNVASTLKKLGIISTSETCYAKLYWNGSNIITEEDAFEEICRGISEPMYQRWVWCHVLFVTICTMFHANVLDNEWTFVMGISLVMYINRKIAQQD